MKEDLATANLLKKPEMYDLFRLSSQIDKRKHYLTITDKEIYTLYLTIEVIEEEKNNSSHKFFEFGKFQSLDELQGLFQDLLMGDDKYYDLLIKYQKVMVEQGPGLITMMYDTDYTPGEIALWSSEKISTYVNNALKKLAA